MSQNTIAYIMIGVLVLFLGTGIIYRISQPVVETAIVNYEEFHNMKHACEKLNEDLCNLNRLPDNDKLFEQFSKSAQITAKRNELNRWIMEYNAKSEMITRSTFKSNSLPFQLNKNQFSCYE